MENTSVFNGVLFCRICLRGLNIKLEKKCERAERDEDSADGGREAQYQPNNFGDIVWKKSTSSAEGLVWGCESE